MRDGPSVRGNRYERDTFGTEPERSLWCAEGGAGCEFRGPARQDHRRHRAQWGGQEQLVQPDQRGYTPERGNGAFRRAGRDGTGTESAAWQRPVALVPDYEPVLRTVCAGEPPARGAVP